MFTIGVLRGVLELEDRFSAGLGVAARNLDAFADNTERVGRVLTAAFTVPLTAIAALSTKTFMAFDAAMRGVEAALQPTQAELKKLEEIALEWGSKTAFSATQSATALMELGKAGMTVGESMRVLPDVLNLAVVGQMDLASAATVTADTLKQMNLTVADAGRVNDILAQGAQKSTADVNSLVQSLKFAGPVAAGLGISLEETVAMLAEFHNIGIKADIAGTSLRNVLTDLASPTKGMRDAMEQLGVETMRSADGSINLADVIDTLRLKTDGTMSSIDRTALVMRMFGDRGGVAMTAVVNKGSEGFRGLVEAMDQADGTAQRVADTLLKGLSGTWTKFLRAIEGAALAIGAVFAPALITILEVGTQVAQIFTNTLVPAFASLPDIVQAAVGAILLFTAGIGPAIYVTGKLAEGIAILMGTRGAAMLSGVFFEIGNSIPVLTARLWLLDAAQKAVTISMGAMNLVATRGFAAALGTVGVALGTIVGVIAAVVGGVRILTGSWEKTWDVLKVGVPPLWLAVEAFKALKYLFDNIGPIIGSVVSFFTDLASVVGFLVQGALGDLVAVFRDFSNVVIKQVSADIQEIKEYFSGFMTTAGDLASVISGPLVLGLTQMWEVVKFLNPGIDLLDDAFRGAMEWAKQFATMLSEARKELHELAAAVNLSMPSVKTIPEMFKASKPALENADQLFDRMHKLIDGEKELRVAIGATTLGYGALTEQLSMTKDAVGNLTKAQRDEIEAGIKLGLSTDEIVKKVNELGAGTKVTAGVIELYKQGQRDATRETKEHNKEIKEQAEFQKQLERSVWDTTKTLMEIENKRLDEAMKGMERSREAILDVLKLKVDAERDTADIIRQITMSELEYKLDTIDREGKARKAGLDLSIELHRQAAEAIDKHVTVSMEQAIRKSEEWESVLVTLKIVGMSMFTDFGLGFDDLDTKTEKAKEKTESWREKVRELSQAFANLSEVGGGLGSFGKITGEILAATDVALQSFDRVSAGVKKVISETKTDMAGGLADIAIGLVGGFGAMMEATDPDKSMASRVLGGAATGAALGATTAATVAIWAKSFAAAGPWAAAAGAVVGVMIAVFRGRAARREMEIVGAEWGMDISKGLFEAINKSSEFGGDRVANSIAKLGEFITEAGGVDSRNLEMFTGKLRDTFVMLSTGMFDVATAQKVLNDNFGTIANASVAAGRLASDALIEIIGLNQTMGVQAEEIINFVMGQAATVGSGLETIAGPITESVGKWHEQVVSTQEALDKMSKDGKEGTQEWIDAQNKLVTLSAEHGTLVAQNATDLEHLGTVAVVTFAAAVRSGVGYVAAVRAITPGIEAITRAQEQLGLTTDNQALKDLINFQAKVEQNATLVAAAEALDETLIAVSHTTGLTEESLKSMGALGVSTFDRLTAAGFTEIEALRMMAPFLQDLIDGHIDLGVPIDENVGKIINMADEMGVLGKESKTMEEVFSEVMGTLTDAINDLIAALRGVPPSVNDITNAVGKVPRTIPIDIEWNVPDVPGINVPEAHGGLPMQNWGSRGTLVKLHNMEGVYTDDQMRDIYANAVSTGASATASGSAMVINIDARGALLGDAASQQQLGRIVESAVDRLANQRRQVPA